MNFAFATLLLLGAAAAAQAMGAAPNMPYTDKRLKFNSDGKFKIMQVADVHFVNGANTSCTDLTPEQAKWPCSDLNSTALLTEMLAREKPDLVVFTGDSSILDQPGTSAGPWKNRYLASYRQLLAPLVAAKVPWMLTFGNHDCEGFVSDCRAQIVYQDRTRFKVHSLTRSDNSDAINGVTNYAYSVAGRDGTPKYVLYVLDGGAYQKYGPNGPSGYDYIRPDQVQWYNATSQAMFQKYGKVIPAVAFFHMPLPEYDTAWSCQYTDYNASNPTILDFGPATSESGTGLRWRSSDCNAAGVKLTGVKQEGVYSPKVNGGLFSSFVMNGDVRMTNVGHDHVNDYCTSSAGIRMCYGGGFGYHAYNTAGFARRARIIELDESGSITTWKRLDGSIGAWAELDRETF